jgi:hypothetical protein
MHVFRLCSFTVWIIVLSLCHGGLLRVTWAAPTIHRLSPLKLLRDDQLPDELPPLEVPVAVRAVRGEFVDLVFAVASPEKDLSGVTVELGELSGEADRTIRVPEERIRTVVCSYCPRGGLGGPADWDAPEGYVYQPYALFYDASLIRPDHKKRRSEITYEGFPNDRPPLKPRPVPTGQLRQWYITIPVPENAAGGTYRGSIRFLSEGQEFASVELELGVLPFGLLPPAKLYGMYHNLRQLEMTDPRYRRMLEDLAEHGFDNVWLFQNRNRVRRGGVNRYFYTDVEHALQLRAEAGMEMDFVLWAGSGIQLHVGQEPGYHQQYVEGNRQLARRLKMYWDAHPELPPLVIYGYDELHGERLRELSSSTYRALNEAGLKVGSACAPGYFEYAGRWMNYPILSGSLEPGTTARATVAKARAAGATVLSYAGPQLIYHDPFLYRLRTGLNLWNSIYDGWYPFTYAWGLDQHEDGRVVTTGRTGNFKVHGVVLVGRERMIPQVEWPAMRQGVWDVRYATTLAAQVLKARELGIEDPRVDEAEKFLRRPLADKPSAEGIVSARRRMLDLIVGLRRSHSHLWPRKLGDGDPGKLARRVNRWIRPDLSYREFPMGIDVLRDGLGRMRELAQSGQPFRATMQGYELVARIKNLREQHRINEVEFAVAKAKIGELLLKEEKKCLEREENVYKEYFRLVKKLNEGWRFRPDRDDLGLKRKWYRPRMDRSDWKPIDVEKFWQQQGRSEWQDLEGPRVGMQGIGWYHLGFKVPEGWEGRELFLWFNSDEDARVYVNGQLVRHRNEGAAVERWHTPSLAPLSDAVKPGRINHIVFRVYNSAQAGGLWRGLMVLEPHQ